jgi:hypothetical protein
LKRPKNKQKAYVRACINHPQKPPQKGGFFMPEPTNKKRPFFELHGKLDGQLGRQNTQKNGLF